MIYFSAETGGFYSDAVHGAEMIPADAIEVPDDQHAALVAAAGSGAEIAVVDGVVISRPRVVAVADARRFAQARLARAVRDALATFTAGVPTEEVASWASKEAEARGMMDGDAGPMIAVEAELTGEDPLDLAALVIARADVYRQVVSRAAGLRRKFGARISGAVTVSEIDEALEDALVALSGLADLVP